MATHKDSCRCCICSTLALKATVQVSTRFRSSVCRASDAVRTASSARQGIPKPRNTTSAADEFQQTSILNDRALQLSQQLLTALSVGAQLVPFVLGVAAVSAGIHAASTRPSPADLARLEQLVDLSLHLAQQLQASLTKYCTLAAQLLGDVDQHITDMAEKHLPALQNKIDEATETSASSRTEASALTGAAVGLGAGSGLGALGSVAAVMIGSIALGAFALPAAVVLGVGAVACACNAADARDNEKASAERAGHFAKQQADEGRNLQLASKEMASLQALLAVLDPTGPPQAPESPGPAQVATKLGVLVCELVCLVQQAHVSLVESLTRAPGSSSNAVDQQEVVSELGDLLTEVRIADSRWRTDIGGMAAGLAATADVKAEGLLKPFLDSSQQYLTSKLSITPAAARLLLEDVKPRCPVDGVMVLLHKTWPKTAAGAISGSPQQGAGSLL